jgi:hypothetical protein
MGLENLFSLIQSFHLMTGVILIHAPEANSVVAIHTVVVFVVIRMFITLNFIIFSKRSSSFVLTVLGGTWHSFQSNQWARNSWGFSVLMRSGTIADIWDKRWRDGTAIVSRPCRTCRRCAGMEGPEGPSHQSHSCSNKSRTRGSSHLRCLSPFIL